MKLVAKSSEDQMDDADESIKGLRKCITAIKTNFVFDPYVAYTSMSPCDNVTRVTDRHLLKIVMSHLCFIPPK